MRIEKKVALMGAAAAAMPWMSEAATLSYQFANIQVSNTGVNGTYTPAGGSLSGTPNAEVLTVDPGSYVKFALQAEVTNDNGGGLFSFDVGLSDSNAATAAVYATSQAAGTQLANPSILTLYDGAKTFGVSDGSGGISSAATGGVFGGFNPQFATLAQGANAAGVFSNLFTSEKIAVRSFGTSTFTPVQINGGTGIMTQPVHTRSGSTTAFYASRGFSPGLDTISALPTLKIVASEPLPHSIISLTQGTVPVVGYNPADGLIAVTGGHGSYNVTTAIGFTAATTGSVLVSGFNPATDQEVFALKLSQNGVAIPPSNTMLLSAIASDINGGGTFASVGVSASLIGGAFASLFPLYDLLITSTSPEPADANGNSVLGFDFSSEVEFNPADAGITVTGVAAVPEPATALGAVLAATGLLLRRRRNRIN